MTAKDDKGNIWKYTVHGALVRLERFTRDGISVKYISIGKFKSEYLTDKKEIENFEKLLKQIK